MPFFSITQGNVIEDWSAAPPPETTGVLNNPVESVLRLTGQQGSRIYAFDLSEVGCQHHLIILPSSHHPAIILSSSRHLASSSHHLVLLPSSRHPPVSSVLVLPSSHHPAIILSFSRHLASSSHHLVVLPSSRSRPS